MIRTCVVALAALHLLSVGTVDSGDVLIRRRRHWVVPPKPLQENQDYTEWSAVARIRSDFQTGSNIDYSLEGVGASRPPFNVFVVDVHTGDVRVTKVLDRETIDTYELVGVARYTNGTLAEAGIDVRIKVVDENDNPPVFGQMDPVNVNEMTPPGTLLTAVTATDADEAGNINSVVAYSLVGHDPPDGSFGVHRNGTVYVRSALDRETQDKYILTVRGQDLNGAPTGNTGTGTITVIVGDANDNLPTLEKDEYEGSVMENTCGVEVMRLTALDQDLEGSDNWEAVFEIVKGNEDGYFSITTDPLTNQGVLRLEKAMDHEEIQNLDLGIAVKNKAPFVGSGTSGGAHISFGGGPSGASGASGANGANEASGPSGGTWGTGGISQPPTKTYPVKINVKNEPEGARFKAVKAINVSEGGQINLKQPVARYPAIDGDTRKPAENVRYAKGNDPANWITIDPETAEIRLNQMPDRESPHLINGTYFAQIFCISEDAPAKTATGTIAIQVEDFNDHCPTLTIDSQTICSTVDGATVNAYDEDVFPNSAPFDFNISPEGTTGKWQVQYLNGTAAVLKAQETLWPGTYEVMLLVSDQQGLTCPEPQKMKIHVCTCEDGVVCGKRGASGQIKKGAELGAAAIGLLLLGLLMLLLIPILLFFCQCGAASNFPDMFKEMPYDTKSHLIKYHTEAQGENTEVPLLNLPQEWVGMGQPQVVKAPFPGFEMQQSEISMAEMRMDQSGAWGMNLMGNSSGFMSGFEGGESAGVGEDVFDGMALSPAFLEQYYNEVASRNASMEVKDSLLMYNSEGEFSCAGSVGCCSLLDADQDLAFLDDLGPKFRTLAEICGGKNVSNVLKQEFTSVRSAPVSSVQAAESSLVTAPQSHQPRLQSAIAKAEQTVVSDITDSSKVMRESRATVREELTSVNSQVGNQSQTLLLQQQQQPVYYTTTPMLQPVHCVVQPQFQNAMILSQAPPTSLQEVVLVNGTDVGPSQGVIFQGQAMMTSGQTQGPSMVLVENGSGIQGSHSNLIRMGNFSGSQAMILLDGSPPSGTMKMVQEVPAGLTHDGTLQRAALAGSQEALKVEESTSTRGQQAREGRGVFQEGVLHKGKVSGVQKAQGRKNGPSAASKKISSSTTVNSTGRKVVMQEMSESH